MSGILCQTLIPDVTSLAGLASNAHQVLCTSCRLYRTRGHTNVKYAPIQLKPSVKFVSARQCYCCCSCSCCCVAGAAPDWNLAASSCAPV